MRAEPRPPRYADSALPNAARFLALVEIEKKILEAGDILDAGPFRPRAGEDRGALDRLRAALVRARDTIAQEAARVLPAARVEMADAIGDPPAAADSGA